MSSAKMAAILSRGRWVNGIGTVKQSINTCQCNSICKGWLLREISHQEITSLELITILSPTVKDCYAHSVIKVIMQMKTFASPLRDWKCMKTYSGVGQHWSCWWPGAKAPDHQHPQYWLNQSMPILYKPFHTQIIILEMNTLGSKIQFQIKTDIVACVNSSDAGVGIFRLKGSIPRLLMPWLLKSPEHQQAWYWLCRTDNMHCCSRINFIDLGQAKSMTRFKLWIYIL